MQHYRICMMKIRPFIRSKIQSNRSPVNARPGFRRIFLPSMRKENRDRNSQDKAQPALAAMRVHAGQAGRAGDVLVGKQPRKQQFRQRNSGKDQCRVYVISTVSNKSISSVLIGI